jgi:hypothetical protein
MHSLFFINKGRLAEKAVIANKKEYKKFREHHT